MDGPDVEALRAVDRFIKAFNAGNRDAVITSFTAHATVSYFNSLVDDFRQRGRPAPDSYTWMVGGALKCEVEVLRQVPSGSFVFQQERRACTGPDGRTGGIVSTVLYKVRDGRVQSVWQLPEELMASAAPMVERPVFGPDQGPAVFVDVAHFNHHKPELSYWPFAELLRRDGYEVRSWPEQFTQAALESAGVDVLVIANATSEKNAEERGWRLPTPSAFTPEEVVEVEAWVREVGRCF
jgi:hypothetical protein